MSSAAAAPAAEEATAEEKAAAVTEEKAAAGTGSRVGGRGGDGAALSPAGAVARGDPPALPPNPSQQKQPAAGAGVSPLPTAPRPPRGAPILWPRDPNLIPGRFPLSGRPSAAHLSFIPSCTSLPLLCPGSLSLLSYALSPPLLTHPLLPPSLALFCSGKFSYPPLHRHLRSGLD